LSNAITTVVEKFLMRRGRGLAVLNPYSKLNYFLGLDIASSNSDIEASNIFTNQVIAIITATDTPP